MIHFTLALIDLAGLVIDTMLWAALVPFAIVATLVGGLVLLRRGRRR